jgi:hypothetical protein
MAVTMKDVRAALDPEEPDYQEAAQLGPDAVPHLEVLVNSGDSMLASKATYLASLIRDAKSAEIVGTAARSDDPVVRVAAAAATSNLPTSGASTILEDLVADPDPGVRKVARASVPDKPTARLTKKLRDLEDETEPTSDSPSELGDVPLAGRPMPGEIGGDEPGTIGTTMPGERATGMPGEQQEMPGG